LFTAFALRRARSKAIPVVPAVQRVRAIAASVRRNNFLWRLKLNSVHAYDGRMQTGFRILENLEEAC
jgi:hypothetical protein